MRIIDTHCHVSPVWYEPVESLICQMDRNGVEKAVLTQMHGQYDNDYLFGCVKRYPGRFVPVVLVDTASLAALQQLERLAEKGARGVRLWAGTRSPGDDPLAIWRKAGELGLSVSCCGSREAFADDSFVEVIEALPGLPLVIEHLGSVNTPDMEPDPCPIRRKVFALARYSNVYVKIHGLGEICRRSIPLTTPFIFDLTGLSALHSAYEAFGPEHMMWGSDYPPVSIREGYTNALRFPLAEFESKPKAEQALIFGGVAAGLYGLD